MKKRSLRNGRQVRGSLYFEVDPIVPVASEVEPEIPHALLCRGAGCSCQQPTLEELESELDALAKEFKDG